MSKCNSKSIPNGNGLSRREEDQALGKPGLPVVRLVQPSSGVLVKKQISGLEAGDYLLDRRENLGASFRAVVGPSRAHAVLMSGNDVELESFELGSPEFREVVSLENARRSGARHGLQFLLWLPEVEQFCVFGFYNAARGAAGPAIFCRQTDRLATFGSRWVQGRSYGFFLPEVEAGELDKVTGLVMPNRSRLLDALELFEG